MIINDNKNDKLKRKHIVKIIFRKKWCFKGDVVLILSITNLLHKYLKPVLIFLGFLVSSNYFFKIPSFL
jgi:hypothetical protein